MPSDLSGVIYKYNHFCVENEVSLHFFFQNDVSAACVSGGKVGGIKDTLTSAETDHILTSLQCALND